MLVAEFTHRPSERLFVVEEGRHLSVTVDKKDRTVRLRILLVFPH
jgi:hypothetical protein